MIVEGKIKMFIPKFRCLSTEYTKVKSRTENYIENNRQGHSESSTLGIV